MSIFDTPRISEKKFYSIPDQLFTANGTADGKVTTSSTFSYKVGQMVSIKSSTQAIRLFKIKRIISETEMYVGDKTTNITVYSDMSAYLVAESAIVILSEQQRPVIDILEIQRQVYAEEPTIAIRSHLVDWLGRSYGNDNPLPITVDGSSIQLLDKTYDSGTETYPLTTQEIVTTFIGGLGGTPVQRITLNYSDATKENLVNFQRENWNGSIWVVG